MLSAEVPRGVPIGCYICKKRQQRTETDAFNYHCTVHHMTTSMWIVCADFTFYAQNSLPNVEKLINALDEKMVYLHVTLNGSKGTPSIEHLIELAPIALYKNWSEAERQAAYEAAEQKVRAMLETA